MVWNRAWCGHHCRPRRADERALGSLGADSAVARTHGGAGPQGRTPHAYRASDGVHGRARRERRDGRRRCPRQRARDARNGLACAHRERRSGARDPAERRQRLRARRGQRRDAVSRAAGRGLQVRWRGHPDRARRDSLRPGRRRSEDPAHRRVRISGGEGRDGWTGRRRERRRRSGRDGRQDGRPRPRDEGRHWKRRHHAPERPHRGGARRGQRARGRHRSLDRSGRRRHAHRRR